MYCVLWPHLTVTVAPSPPPSPPFSPFPSLPLPPPSLPPSLPSLPPSLPSLPPSLPQDLAFNIAWVLCWFIACVEWTVGFRGMRNVVLNTVLIDIMIKHVPGCSSDEEIIKEVDTFEQAAISSVSM